MILGASGLARAGTVKALLAIVLVLFAFAYGLWTGRELATAEHDAQRTRELARAFDRYQEQVAAGEATAEQLHASLQRLSQHHATVTGALRHATLLARAPAPLGAMPLCAAAAAPAAAGTTPPPAAAGNVPADSTPGAAPPDSGGGLRLTLAAVSLWNSALAGAHVPAGACSTAGAAGPAGLAAACADTAPVGLADAWANHAENAARCAANAARHRALLEHLNKQLPSEPRR